MTTRLQSYNTVPRLPLQQPISSHPIGAPCGPGAGFPEGHFANRGGVFEGPQMASSGSQCGYFTDYTGTVQTRTWPLVARNGVPTGAEVSAVPGWPHERRVGFQPRDIALGYPTRAETQQWERANAAIAAAGFGNISAPGVNPGMQLMDPMRLIDNRTQAVWTGPLTAQEDWPGSSTPRGGVLDGNSLNIRGQSPTSAYYHGASPHVMLPPTQINVLPNPTNMEPIPQVGWGIPQPMSGMGEYTPTAGPARAPRRISPRSYPERQSRTIQRRGVASSIFGGSVPGNRRLAQSIFSTPVYEFRPGNVPAQMTIDPFSDPVPATNQYAALTAASGFGAGPDGLGQ